MQIVFLTMNSFSKFVTYKRAVGMGESLAKLGHHVYIVALDCQENRERMQVEAPHCIPLWYDANGIFLEVVQKLRHLRKICPDYVYSSVYSIRNLSGLQLFYPKQTRSILEFCELYSGIEKHKRRWAKLEYLALRHYDMFLCASNYLKTVFIERLCRLGWNKPITYSPYAYPVYLKPLPKSGDGQKRIMFMASLWKGYGIFDVLAAFELVAKQLPDAKLDVLGRGPAMEEAMAWVGAHGLTASVVFHGYVAESDINAWFSKASVFISPLHDTVQDRARCPSKLYYYLPYNKPIVTCELGDPYDTLGPFGYYYKPDDVSDMARALIRALNDSDGFEYPKDFLARHSWDARAADFVKWHSSMEENEKKADYEARRRQH